jgi:ABC-2 type transport system ATP-binding protein
MHRERGLTVMLTSHDLGDIEELCERMIMIDKGRIVYDGALAEVTARFGWERTIHLTLPEPDPEAVDVATATLTSRQGATASQPDPTTLTVTFDSRQMTPGELIRDLATAIPVTDIRIDEPSAESVIRRLYEGDLQFDADHV